MSGRFPEDCRRGRKEEKGHLCALRHCAQRNGRVEEGWEAKRKMEEIEGAEVRRVAIFYKAKKVGWREQVVSVVRM